MIYNYAYRRYGQKNRFSIDTIRFYEKQGLIQVGRKEGRENNYKEYSEKTLANLLTIKRIKGFGFTLNEIAGFLELIENKHASCDNVADKMYQKIESIEAKIKELQPLKAIMLGSIEQCTGNKTDNCPILIGDLSEP